MVVGAHDARVRIGYPRGPAIARVVVIDDDVRIRELLNSVLARANHEVLVAADGRQGLQLIDQHRPDLVITDIFMPEMDGLDVISRLAGHAEVKIIAISGGADLNGRHLDYLEDARAFGAWAVLQKPFRTDQLLATVAEALAQ
jgi:CheY-like chemotaxis protein